MCAYLKRVLYIFLGLKFLVQLCNDLRMPEKKEYEDKLKKIERVNQLRMQRESDSSHNRRIAPSAQSNSITPSSSRNSDFK
jgi:hypothetical protein